MCDCRRGMDCLVDKNKSTEITGVSLLTLTFMKDRLCRKRLRFLKLNWLIGRISPKQSISRHKSTHHCLTITDGSRGVSGETNITIVGSTISQVRTCIVILWFSISYVVFHTKHLGNSRDQ